jgi:hypothetical protein
MVNQRNEQCHTAKTLISLKKNLVGVEMLGIIRIRDVVGRG